MYSESLKHSKQEGNMIRFAFLNCHDNLCPQIWLVFMNSWHYLPPPPLPQGKRKLHFQKLKLSKNHMLGGILVLCWWRCSGWGRLDLNRNINTMTRAFSSLFTHEAKSMVLRSWTGVLRFLPNLETMIFTLTNEFSEVPQEWKSRRAVTQPWNLLAEAVCDCKLSLLRHPCACLLFLALTKAVSFSLSKAFSSFN